MEKTEAVNKLKKAGYQVQFDSSVVTVILPPKVNTNQEIKKLRSFLDEIGYCASFGIKQLKGTERTDFGMFQEEETTERSISLKPEVEETADDGFEESEFVEIGEQFSLEDFGIS